MDVLRTAPSRSEFTLLSEHQSQTPPSFYDGPAILYHQSSGCTFKASARDLAAAAAFEGLVSSVEKKSNGPVNGHLSEEIPVGGEHEDESLDVEIPNLDIWVTSKHFILFSPSSNVGVSISYPSISLHAVQRSPDSSTTSASALYLQLLPEANATFDDHDPDETGSLYIVPNPSRSTTAHVEREAPSEPGSESAMDSSDEVSKIYTALSACANLHPDPPLDDVDDMNEDEDDEGMIRGQRPGISFFGHTDSDTGGGALIDGDTMGGLPPPMPGSSGWITAENVGEFFDEDGNWKGRDMEGSAGELGEGAGRIRERDEEDVEGEDSGETKWTRTG